MKTLLRVLLLTPILCGSPARGQSAQRDPHIGYLYPAGGRQDSTFRITVGGQNLRGASNVYISGEGVRATVVGHYRPLRNLSAEQRQELRRRLRECSERRWNELHEQGRVGANPPWERDRQRASDRPGAARGDEAPETEPVQLPDHPLINDLEGKSLRELRHVREMLFNSRKRQPNAQIAETVVIEVFVDEDAVAGDRELRLETRMGLTNPLVFQVGALPEVCELESNDPGVSDPLPEEPPLELPVLINGQIMPGDVDRFRFRARQGQPLVIAAHARRLIPYLADAVPGWFQATLALYDAAGDELAFADDYRFDPDPVLFFEIPADGEYELEIRDSIYRGREDFVYRISVGAQPFITSTFPLGSRTGHGRYVAIDGWNLTNDRLFLDPQPDAAGIHQKAWGRGKRASNPVTYVVDTVRAVSEAESNDTAAGAQRITLPRIINGRIAPPGDVDTFTFEGKAGDELVAEIVARRLSSPLDSLLRLTDATGRVLAWNDDCEHKDGFLHTDMGQLTHHADSYLRARLPTDGAYCVQVSDALNHGGDAFGYRLRVGPPQPDFALRLTPSSVNVATGRAAPVCVYALRKDGFDGAIELVLKNAPAGFRLDGARIPAGRDRVRLTLTAPRRRLDRPVSLQLEGRAAIAGETVRRPIVPCEDLMQAFLYRHLTPAQELLVATTGGRRGGPPVALAHEGPVRIPAGGSSRVRVKTARNPQRQEVELALDEPPAGITLHDVAVVPDGLEFQLRADREALAVGFADNLIVEAFAEIAGEGGDDQADQPQRRVFLGVLPAIPFEIVPG